jgi:hypothetical protein
MNSILVNWKTTVGGALMVATGIAGLCGVSFEGGPVSPETSFGLITGGLGLMFAKDSNVTGGTKPQ